MHYAILDYDGYICKSYFAGKGEYDKCCEILEKLTQSALYKSQKYYKSDEIKAIKIVSGHCWKKDLYNTYKQNREKNPYIGAYRDFIIEQDKTILKPETLEADELCIMCHDYLINCGKNCIVFSDDKDILYTSLVNCKINLTEQIDIRYDGHQIYQQMLAGDKEDDIKGINKVGMKTANKILQDNGFNIQGVIKTYKDKNIPEEECLKNINLIIPMKREFNDNVVKYDAVARRAIDNNQLFEDDIKLTQQGQLNFLTKRVKEIYI